MKSKEIVYTTGQVTLLHRMLRDQIRNSVHSEEVDVLQALLDVTRYISKKFKTMSEVYFDIRAKNTILPSCIELKRVLFHEDIGKMPLLLNEPVSGVIARFRLQIGV
jgi:hypothetical protein